MTFFRPKLGHFLGPGADKIGNAFVEDIGIPETIIPNFDCKVFHNKPKSWGIDFPSPGPVTNKFDRGHLTIVGGKNDWSGSTSCEGGALEQERVLSLSLLQKRRCQFTQ
ncbi:MAG: hypothetical protein VX597_00130 [Pseudomonadota bacterium]|nr:hypothetical protein [Pseudomonadota bacterium]